MSSSKKPEVNNFKSPQLKLSLGVALLILGFLLFAGRNKTQNALTSSFENEPLSFEDLSVGELDEAKIPRKILIPRLSIDLEVKKANIVGGYWEVFPDTAGWGIGSGIPGETGNQVIFAHAREGLFLPLRSIKEGDLVYVLTDSNWHKYEVREIREVSPDQIEVVQPTEDETLTLYTCSGFEDQKRLIVTSKRI